ncbi:MAG: 4-hydroxy-tetrahydrodipicolinate reductase [Sphaerochaetaceae bacterium]|nr:4-hydroxy-tetrahydrodipicolinate reductase [Spirochaetales bacterium]MDY5499193.1 4-hydroxy-tetrahydrodipicolinate reductase [Sphaerochaetaceae bacterium]
MRIGIVGYGKMGHLVRNIALGEGHEVTLVVDPLAHDAEVTDRVLEGRLLTRCDVLIEFSSPHAIMEHLRWYAAHPCRAVVGTTGWYDNLPEVEKLMAHSLSSIIYSGNYSLGVAVFLRLVRQASRLLDSVGGYDAGVLEMHHRGKADAPSGTALMVAGEIATSTGQTRIVTGNLPSQRRQDEVQVASLRVGSLAGTHTAIFDSEADTIELTHRARTRGGFAKGALLAAGWLMDQKPGLYTIDDLVGRLLTD